MVAHSRTPLRADRLRALNAPQPATVELDAGGSPTAVKASNGMRKVEFVNESWRIDDEWWRQPIARRYYEVVLNGGKRVVLFEDRITGEWWMQKPA